MRHRNIDDYFAVNEDGYILAPKYDLDGIKRNILERDLTVLDGPSGRQRTGNLDGTESLGDVYPVELLAGVTYSFAQRPTAEGGIEDPFLILYNPDGSLNRFDDDGGAGRSSILTITPTVTGTYYVVAGSWVNIFSSGGDTGNYTIDQWQPATSPDAPAVTAGAPEIEVGVTTFGHLTSGDVDVFQINVTAGNYYNFLFSGGVASNAERTEPGSVRATLQLLDSNGAVIATNAANEAFVGFTAEADGTYYVRLAPAGGTGGYTLDVDSINLASLADEDPLEALYWDSAANIPTTMVDGVPTAYVYFAPAGENFGETADDGVTPMTTYGWTTREMTQVMEAFAEYTKILGINYVVTENADQATFRMMTTTSTLYGAYAYPQDPAYGTQKGIVVFNVNSGGWDKPGVSSQDIPGDQVSLDRGGFSFAVILHELGHAHGLAHPHDNGGGSDILAGVVSSTDSYGVYNLNQGVYTVMSYNDAWDFHPNGPSSFTINGINNGWSGSLSAFDIGALQNRYDVHLPRNTDDTVYTLVDVADDAFYETIWDTGGTDTIAYGGALNAQIDLLAATLDYSPTGGGVVSFLYNAAGVPASLQIKGGYTIANGVVIENATGGSGNDVLLGNAAANVLTGNGGNDTILGRDGVDVARLGGGDDIFIAEVTATKLALKGPQKGSMSVDIITDFDGVGLGDDKIDVSDLGDFTFKGTDSNKNAGDLTYKTFISISGAENALGIDIDGRPGAGGVSGPVTVVYGNTNGGSADFAIILLNTSSVDASDFIF